MLIVVSILDSRGVEDEGNYDFNADQKERISAAKILNFQAHEAGGPVYRTPKGSVKVCRNAVFEVKWEIPVEMERHVRYNI